MNKGIGISGGNGEANGALEEGIVALDLVRAVGNDGDNEGAAETGHVRVVAREHG